jgi:hypothetical protein
MTILDPRQWESLETARVQPYLCLVNFSLRDTLETVRAEYFPEIQNAPAIYFVNRGSLACICTGSAEPTIYVHAILNHPNTPVEVITAICKHELLHLRIRPREINGRMRQHPPEFWDAEKSLTPELSQAWDWIWRRRRHWLKNRPRLERIDVRRNWREIWDSDQLPSRLVDFYSKKRERIEFMLSEGGLYL